MSLISPFSRRLYLRIWLAVVGGVLVFAFAVGLAWRWAAEHNAQNLQQPPAREIVITDASGKPVLQGLATRERREPGEPSDYSIETESGDKLQMQLSARGPRPDGRGGPPRDVAFWLRPPFGFIWMLAAVGIAVTIGVFPIIRKLLQRLENLQRSVKRFGEGDLKVRVRTQGHDEVADLARQFNAAASRIETLVDSHKSLLANASHELRSPLTRIRMGMELMQDGVPSPASRAEILRNITELDQLVDEILLASRLDAGATNIGTLEPVDLLGLSAEECMRVDAELNAHTDGLAATDLDVQGISKLLRRAVRNLLENARRYSLGEITLDLSREGDHAVIRVSDHGPGVPVDQRERIFEPFYRLPGASERSGGVGLGLALVRSIAERHHGSVHCEGRADGASGACFVLRLPVGLV
ncbi:ATP-binding protein [Diaphorobacter caeni]|uniref:ATP-binding protein n=1 Tax=Diaphorobacter caeni TaxID=2784387 RepID=UPI00188F2B50|nr:ATP-binding protein [Diaphorobacter caeni]MBF5005455.1 HAMP domain-containing protein [Diaphorobacter caeni]